MLLNQDIALSTPQVLLVPYDEHHVPEYHAWMQRPELQELTASEPLTLEEEHAMQRSWRADTDKLTFIVCLPFAGRPDGVRAAADDTADQMIGDINLFVSDDPDSSAGVAAGAVVGEVEIMIAKPGATGQGRGRAALLAFLRYIYERQADICTAFASGKGLREAGVGPQRFQYLRVKIGQGNAKSISLFQSLGFQGPSEPNHFGEIELRLQGELGEGLRVWEERWPGSVSKVEVVPYERSTTVESAEATDEEMTG